MRLLLAIEPYFTGGIGKAALDDCLLIEVEPSLVDCLTEAMLLCDE